MSAIFEQAVLDSDATKVKFLFKYVRGIRIDQANKHGLTALQQASWDGNMELVNFLLENGADLSLVDREGRSPLHLAAHAGHLEVVSLLVNSACADVNAKTERGLKPIDLAKTDQIRALLSQVMLADGLKRRCTLTPSESEWDSNVCGGKLNVPGSRYSISSTSTDSGVLEDFGPAEGYVESKHAGYAKTGSVCASESHNHEAFPDPYSKDMSDVERVRRTSASCTRGKSQSFSGRHDYATIYESDAGSGKLRREVSPPERTRSSKRNPKLTQRDPTRRRTVTFGENELRTISNEPPLRPRSSSFRRATISSQAERAAIPSYYSPERGTRERRDESELAGSWYHNHARGSYESSKLLAQKSSARDLGRESKDSRDYARERYSTKTLH